MIFAKSAWLWACFAVPLIYVLLIWDQKKRQKDLARLISSDLWSILFPSLDWGRRRRKILLWTLGLLGLMVALSRPQWGVQEETVRVTGMDIVFVLDVSNSMNVEDVPPSRLKKAHHLIRSMIEQLQGDRVGIVAFAGSSFLASPLTTDLNYVLDILPTLSPRVVANQGTDIGLGLETAVKALERGAENSGDKDVPSRAIVLVSDGEDLEENAAEGARAVGETGIRLFVFGVGTDKGGPIPIRSEEGELTGYKKDSQGQPIVSQFRPQALETISSLAHGKYWQATPAEQEVETFIRDLKSLHRGDRSEARRVVHEERYQIPLALGLLFLLMEMWVSVRSPSGRAMLLLLVGCALQHSASANSFNVYRLNEQGIRAFQAGHMDDAKEKFGRAQALDPDRPELEYNQSIMEMQQKNTSSAVKGFESAAQKAMDEADSNLSARSHYNLGSALAAAGNTDQAYHAYLNALHEAQKNKDKKLEEVVRQKIETLTQQKQEQPQQGSNQKKEKEQQKKDPEQKPNAPKEEPSSPGKNAQSQEGRNFESKKLTRDDAERVMTELSEKEKELQAKLRKQKGQAQQRGKDW